MAECTRGSSDGRKVLDADTLFDDILAEKGPQKYTDGLTEENWEEELEHIPLFMTKSPEVIDPIKAPGLAALQDLKYQLDTPAGRASAHKEEGNEHFRLKRYRQAIVEYSSGLSEEGCDVTLKAVLYTNRGATHLRLGNLRSCLNDVTEAKKLKPDHLKAFYRGVEALMKLKEYEEAIDWCNQGLRVNSEDDRLRELWSKASKEKKQQDRDQRKQNRREKAKEMNEMKLLDAIKARGIHLAPYVSMTTEEDENVSSKMQYKLNCSHPSGEMVHFNPEGHLVWPVLFLYPEYGQTDLISSFNEHQRFQEHLDVLFGEDNAPPWNHEGRYKPDSVHVYFEDSLVGGVISVDTDRTLGDVISCKGYTICEGTPSFILLSSISPFTEHFLKRYS